MYIDPPDGALDESVPEKGDTVLSESFKGQPMVGFVELTAVGPSGEFAYFVRQRTGELSVRRVEEVAVVRSSGNLER